MKITTANKPFYLLFILFAIIEMIERSHMVFPSMTIILSIGLYYWVYLTIRHTLKISLFKEFNGVILILLFTFWNSVILVRGLFDCTDYWDYKTIFFNKGPFLFFALSIFLATKPNLLRNIIYFLLKYYLILSLIFIKPAFWGNTGRIISNLLPLSLLFIKKNSIYILLFTIITLPFTWGARGWILRACYGLLLALLFYWWKISFIRDYVFNSILKLSFWICIIMPLIFVYLGYTGKFNVFAMDQYISVKNKENIVDTRSFLYRKVNQKLEKSDLTWIGLGGISNYWDDFYENAEVVSSLRNKGRMATESGLLNMYLYGGYIGAFLFSCLFWYSAYCGIYKSLNIVCKLIGGFIIFRWVISFVDEPEVWLCSNLMMYMFMGICLNKKLRKLSNNEWFHWFKTIKKV